MPIDPQVLAEVIQRTTDHLDANFIEKTYCEGHLSSSALSTAVSCIALKTIDSAQYKNQVQAGLDWIKAHMNQDGGWGDTIESPSNLSTTLLCWAALKGDPWCESSQLQQYLSSQLGELTSQNIIEQLKKTYGEDKTFAVPICMALAVSDRLGPEPTCWKYVDALPFEFAAAPQSWYSHFKMSVVSYAIPALISIGILKHKKNRTIGPLGWLRSLLVQPCLNKLRSVQPSHGGFLEAVPLTGFTAMALFKAGFEKHDVIKKASEFLLTSIRNDGSSPIDTNLSCWVTSLSLQTLDSEKSKIDLNKACEWLASKQWQVKDPYAGAEAGGWAWTLLPGGVPDADDTSAALLALMKHDYQNQEVLHRGIQWLLNLQNRDGGMPTFCRGWGQLPFDQSCNDITAHALRVFSAYRERFPGDLNSKLEEASKKAYAYLRRQQREDGSWLPLWFGSQDHSRKENPVYGTAKVIQCLNQPEHQEMKQKALLYLKSVQKPDGSFGGHKNGKSSIEETSLALSVMTLEPSYVVESDRAMQWLLDKTEQGKNFPSSPIGLYFAALWYSEKMYPIIFFLEALNKYKKPY